MGTLKVHQKTHRGEISGWAHSQHLLTTCSVCWLHGLTDAWGAQTLDSLMAQGSHYPWKDAVLSPSWSFLEETGPRWWSITLPSICPTSNNAFHGLIKHMVSAPNSLLGKYVRGAFSGLFAYGYMMWTRMVVIWVLLKIVLLCFSIEKSYSKKKKKVDEVRTHDTGIACVLIWIGLVLVFTNIITEKFCSIINMVQKFSVVV